MITAIMLTNAPIFYIIVIDFPSNKKNPISKKNAIKDMALEFRLQLR